MKPFRIEAARLEWAYPQMGEHLETGERVWVEVSESFYWQAMEVVPPLFVTGGFMLGEAHSSDAEGHTIYATFMHLKDRYFAMYTTRKALPVARLALLAALDTEAVPA
jgi:hypothetical protein